MVPSYWRMSAGALAGLLLLVALWGMAERGARAKTLNDHAGLQQQSKSAQSDLTAAQDEAKRLADSCRIKDAALENARTQITTLEAKLDSSEKAGAAFRTKLTGHEKAAAEKEVLAAELEKLKAKHLELLAKQGQVEKKAAVQQNENEKAFADAGKAQKEWTDQVQSLTKQLEETRTALKASEESLAQMRTQSNAQQKTIGDKEGEIKRLQDLGTKVWSELSAAKKQIAELNTEIERLKKTNRNTKNRKKN